MPGYGCSPPSIRCGTIKMIGTTTWTASDSAGTTNAATAPIKYNSGASRLRRIACRAARGEIPGRRSPAWKQAYQRNREKLDAVSNIATLSMNAAGAVPGYLACN